VFFRPTVWRPRVGQFANRYVRGVQLILRDACVFRPLRTALTVLTTLRRLHPKDLKVKDPRRFARVWGNSRIWPMIQSGMGPDEIERTWQEELAAFAKKRAKYLIYPE